MWYQVFASDPAARSKTRSAIESGCRVICVTLGSAAAARGSSSAPEWNAIASLAGTSTVPLIVKGVATPEAAMQAISRGAQGVVVSVYNPANGSSGESPVLQLAGIVDRQVRCR